jgi:hypothetical protein
MQPDGGVYVLVDRLLPELIGDGNSDGGSRAASFWLQCALSPRSAFLNDDHCTMPSWRNELAYRESPPVPVVIR